MKFIRKVRVLDECWIDVPGKGNMPLEIHLLTTLSHPHIVQVRIRQPVSIENWKSRPKTVM